ncbi:hypothetical protein KCU88_g7095, partial [Aureobasidium melanogenum]
MNAGRPPSSPKEPDVESRDSILITRMFPVTLPDSQDDLRQHRSSNAGNADPSSATSPVKDQLESPGVQGKKPKLVEKKTPVYAAALLCYLPRPGDARPGTSTARPMSRASAMASSYPNSYGSDSLSSWTILSAIPDHLSSPETSAQFNDQSIEVIVKNWDVILRSLVVVERAARARICDLLQEVNSAMIFSAAKAPKGPSEQRTNQRNVYLRSSNALVRDSALQNVVKHALWRVSYALRIPRVASGFGLDYGGPWLDEARYLVRVCGNKQQNFFLFNLLTAFLGNHTDWLECIGPDRNETAPSSLRDRRKHAPKTSPVYGLQPHYLQQMVDEAADLTMTQPPTRPEERPVEPPAESAPSDVQPPRMRVDDKDGVVDVDINLPGFISWDESKGPLSPSIRHDSPTRFSIDGAASSYSSRSTRFRSADSRTTNVAGYLRRYHEDFILQGVKPYPELYDEIKQSMSQEPALDDDSLGSFPDEEADGKLWVNVCSTLLVDSRTFSIERLTLQRRVFRNRPVVSHADSSSLAGTGNTSNTSITAPQLKFSDPMEERFVTEPVMDFDSTLTDAIERVLNEGYPSKQDIPNPARADSRALSVGTTASARTEPLEISGSSKSKKWSHLSTLSQADCRQAVVGALEDVVRSVSGDLTKHQRTRHVDGHTRLDGDILAHGVKQDNVLREGVKKWVLNIETQNVW